MDPKYLDAALAVGVALWGAAVLMKRRDGHWFPKESNQDSLEMARQELQQQVDARNFRHMKSISRNVVQFRDRKQAS